MRLARACRKPVPVHGLVCVVARGPSRRPGGRPACRVTCAATLCCGGAAGALTVATRALAGSRLRSSLVSTRGRYPNFLRLPADVHPPGAVRVETPLEDARDCPLRIVLAPSAYYPHVGGIEETTRQLALAYRRRGHSVSVLTNRWPEGVGVHELLDSVE